MVHLQVLAAPLGSLPAHLVLLQVLTLAPQHLDGCIVVSHDLVSLLELVAKLANRDLRVCMGARAKGCWHG
eukprot:364363-Chlamydomonas_euryale.AAC.2